VNYRHYGASVPALGGLAARDLTVQYLTLGVGLNFTFQAIVAAAYACASCARARRLPCDTHPVAAYLDPPQFLSPRTRPAKRRARDAPAPRCNSGRQRPAGRAVSAHRGRNFGTWHRYAGCVARSCRRGGRARQKTVVDGALLPQEVNMAITPYRASTGRLAPLFEDMLRPMAGWGRVGSLLRAPEADVVETETEIRVLVELPGMNPEDVGLDMENNVLTISGEKKEERQQEHETWHLSERRYGKFSRSFVLPRDVDQESISAEFDGGVLSVTIPKSEKARRRRIEIRNGGGRQSVGAPQKDGSRAADTAEARNGA
jgi:HSP20 family protein